MTPPRAAVVSLFLLSLAAACAVPSQRIDFASNELLYADVAFATKSPGDRELFVAPVVDARDLTALPTQERGFPIAYGGDDFWERPVHEMLAEVLQRQLDGSHLFARLVEQPTPSSLLLKPTLVTFAVGSTEAISGRRSFAEVGLRLQVLGPAAANGERATVFDHTYGNRQLSEQELNPISPYRLVGVALHRNVAQLLAGLDGSNVGRSNVPLEAAAAPASAPATPR